MPTQQEFFNNLLDDFPCPTSIAGTTAKTNETSVNTPSQPRQARKLLFMTTQHTTLAPGN